MKSLEQRYNEVTHAMSDCSFAVAPETFSLEHAMAMIDDVLEFVRGGLDALRKR